MMPPPSWSVSLPRPAPAGSHPGVGAHRKGTDDSFGCSPPSPSAILQYADVHAEDDGRTDWQNLDIVDSFLWALFDAETGQFAGADKADSVQGTLKEGGDYASIQQIAIAYSALDAGERPFGDAGIRALFNDLNDLGRIQSKANHDPWLDQLDFEWRAITLGIPTLTLTTSISGILARAVTQYAAALAIHGVDRSDVDDVLISEGIIRIAEDNKTMAADFSSVYWRDVLNEGLTPWGGTIMEIKDGDELLSRYFEQSAENRCGPRIALVRRPDGRRSTLRSRQLGLAGYRVVDPRSHPHSYDRRHGRVRAREPVLSHA